MNWSLAQREACSESGSRQVKQIKTAVIPRKANELWMNCSFQSQAFHCLGQDKQMFSPQPASTIGKYSSWQRVNTNLLDCTAGAFGGHPFLEIELTESSKELICVSTSEIPKLRGSIGEMRQVCRKYQEFTPLCQSYPKLTVPAQIFRKSWLQWSGTTLAIFGNVDRMFEWYWSSKW